MNKTIFTLTTLLSLTAISSFAETISEIRTFNYHCEPYQAGMVGFDIETSYQGTARPDLGHAILGVNITGLNYTDEQRSNMYFEQELTFNLLTDFTDAYQIKDADVRISKDLFWGGNRTLGACGKADVESLGASVDIVDYETNKRIRFWCSRPLNEELPEPVSTQGCGCETK